ncbi:MAG: DUF1036 domain-containing protein [Rhizomicrobium sp.]|nr:DUF1036 domain-containing protein [Rhizomicrobium sp.]
MGRAFSLAGLTLTFALTAAPTHAALSACNRTSYVLYAAAAVVNVPNVSVQGWTRIAPGACAVVFGGDLTADAYYLTARSSRAHSGSPRAWSGPTNFCVKDKTFSWTLPFGARCPADGFELGFAQIDTHHMRVMTTTLRETPDLPSMPAAEHAGLRRLLGDSGARDVSDDKKLDAALQAFRQRLHLAANAPKTALFDALETEALKSAVPAGYTLCNDSKADFGAAIGQKAGAAFVSRGWWTVAAGSCSHLITDPIGGQKIWLRVERGKGPPLLGGPNGFCVTSIEFDIQGRENCAKRGLTPAGFAETNLKGASGFIAHVADTGLVGAR